MPKKIAAGSDPSRAEACPVLWRMTLAGILAGLACLATTASPASPVTYRAEVVTDVKLANTVYRNAALTLTFHADTDDATAVVDQSGTPIMSGVCSFASFFWITKGDASLKIEVGSKTISAVFKPNQLFVGADVCAGGIGIGSYVASGLEPGYPLAFTRGSAEYQAGGKSTDVFLPTFHVSGNAFSCVGYANLDDDFQHPACTSPDAYPLHTDKGDFFIYMPYTASPSDNPMRNFSLNRGTFSAIPGKMED
jgi:hypothetical protein